MPLMDAIAAVTCHPAEVLDIGAGTLSKGAPADLCIFDPAARWTVGTDTLISQGKNSPFLGWELQGRVTHTLLGGRVVHGETGQPS